MTTDDDRGRGPDFPSAEEEEQAYDLTERLSFDQRLWAVRQAVPLVRSFRGINNSLEVSDVLYVANYLLTGRVWPEEMNDDDKPELPPDLAELAEISRRQQDR